MQFSPGTKLGPYEIISPLGAGGMGEVYRARDTRLGRDVAIKVLPQHLSSNPEVRARFERCNHRARNMVVSLSVCGRMTTAPSARRPGAGAVPGRRGLAWR